MLVSPVVYPVLLYESGWCTSATVWSIDSNISSNKLSRNHVINKSSNPVRRLKNIQYSENNQKSSQNGFNLLFIAVFIKFTIKWLFLNFHKIPELISLIQITVSYPGFTGCWCQQLFFHFDYMKRAWCRSTRVWSKTRISPITSFREITLSNKSSNLVRKEKNIFTIRKTTKNHHKMVLICCSSTFFSKLL